MVITKESTALPDQFTKQIRVLCVDDHRLVREGIALIINRERDMTVVGSAASGPDAIALFKQYSPDVTLMDLKLGRMSGLEAIRAIRQYDGPPASSCLCATETRICPRLDRRRHYLLKDMLSGDLINMIREVCAGATSAVGGIRPAGRAFNVCRSPRVKSEVLDRVRWACATRRLLPRCTSAR